MKKCYYQHIIKDCLHRYYTIVNTDRSVKRHSHDEIRKEKCYTSFIPSLLTGFNSMC